MIKSPTHQCAGKIPNWNLCTFLYMASHPAMFSRARNMYLRDRPQFSFFLIIFYCLNPCSTNMWSLSLVRGLSVSFYLLFSFLVIEGSLGSCTMADTRPGQGDCSSQLNPTKVGKCEKGRRLTPTPRAASRTCSLHASANSKPHH